MVRRTGAPAPGRSDSRSSFGNRRVTFSGSVGLTTASTEAFANCPPQTPWMGGDADPADRYAPGRESAVVAGASLMHDPLVRRLEPNHRAGSRFSGLREHDTAMDHGVSEFQRQGLVRRHIDIVERLRHIAFRQSHVDPPASRPGNAPRNHPSSPILKVNSGEAPRPPKNT